MIKILLAFIICTPFLVTFPEPGHSAAPALPGYARAAEPGTQEKSDAPPAAQKYFTDTELVNQDGEPMRFYSDLLKNRVVLINTFYTTCTSSCPPMNAGLAKLQESFPDQFGKQLYFISISVDPLTDTPERLKAYATKFHARPGWYFLTGKKENVEFMLRKLGQYVEKKEDHLIVVIIGNEKTGLWKKAFGLAKTDELGGVIRSVLDDKAPDDK